VDRSLSRKRTIHEITRNDTNERSTNPGGSFLEGPPLRVDLEGDPNDSTGSRRMREEAYNYDTFQRHMIKRDLHFQGGPEPGQLAPDFKLPTTDGGSFRLSDFRNKQPVLIEFGSIT